MENIQITMTDATIIIGYFIVVLIVGLFISKSAKNAKDLFLAGRSLHWVPIGFSLFASNISSSTLIGVVGAAYLYGISVANYEWMAAFVLVFILVFILPVFIRTKISTIPEYLELRYNKFTRHYFSIVTIILNIIVDLAGFLYAGAVVLHFFFPSIPIGAIIVFLALIAGTYTAVGGLSAVVYTDILQAIIIIMSSSILLYAILGQFDYSWDLAFSKIGANKTSFIRPSTDTYLPWTGTLFGLPILGFYYWVLNQQISQRLLAAKNINNARWGALLGGFLKLPVFFLLVVPGVLAFQLFPELGETSNLVFPTVVSELIPTGVLGIILVGVIAAIMSSADSAINSASTLIVLDFVEPNSPKLKPKQILYYGRIITIGIMLFAIIWAMVIGSFKEIFDYLQKVLSYMVPPVVVVFILGIFWRRGNSQAAMTTLIGGHIISLSILALSSFGYVNIHFTVLAGILTIVSAIMYITIVLLTNTEFTPKDEQTIIEDFSFLSVPIKDWRNDYRVISAILILCTIILVIGYW